MKKIDQYFLEALCCFLENRRVEWDDVTNEEWVELFRMAKEHNVLPMIYEAVYTCSAIKKADPSLVGSYKRMMLREVMMQTMKTEEFYQLNRHLKAAGVRFLAVKGIVCRSMYPKPDCRPSSDEDLILAPGEFEKCHQAMLDFGMVVSNPQSDLLNDYEIPYGKPGSPLYIEIHKSLFPEGSEAYGELNRYFAHIFDEKTEKKMISVNGNEISTMQDTQHLFYLICHAFKHFLHSGFGIRQVCDIIMYANVEGKNVDWQLLLAYCKEIHAELFSAAIFRIGKKYLVFDEEKAGYPMEWKCMEVDETAMLEDLLDAGIYGDSEMSRKHSSNITLNAVVADKRVEKLPL